VWVDEYFDDFYDALIEALIDFLNQAMIKVKFSSLSLSVCVSFVYLFVLFLGRKFGCKWAHDAFANPQNNRVQGSTSYYRFYKEIPSYLTWYYY